MFECYFLKINIANNKHCKKGHNRLRIQLMQWQAHRLRGSFADNKKKQFKNFLRHLNLSSNLQTGTFILINLRLFV